MNEVTHKDLFEKLVEHEEKFVEVGKDIKGIREDLDPIANGVRSMAWSFKALIGLGVVSGAVVGIMELAERL